MIRRSTKDRSTRSLRLVSAMGFLTLALILLGAMAGLAAPAQAATPAWKVLAATGPTNLPPVTSEIQELKVDAEGGTFVLSFEGQSTEALPYDATAAELAAALDSLPTIAGAGGAVEANGGPGGAGAASPYFVRFAGQLAAADVPALGADSSSLTGSVASVSVTTPTEGGAAGAGTIALYLSNVGGLATSGTVSVDAHLPQGIVTSAASPGGESWTCEPSVAGLSSVACSTGTSVVPGTNAKTLSIPIVVEPTALPSSEAVFSISGGGAGATTYDEPITVSDKPAAPGIQALWAGAFDADGSPSVQAGAHPFSAATGFLVDTILAPSGQVIPAGDPRDAEVDLPPGFLGNALTTSRCPQNELFEQPVAGACTVASSGVGRATPVIQNFGKNAVSNSPNVFDDVPSFGYPAQFTFPVLQVSVSAFGELRSDGDYGITVNAVNLPQGYKVFGSFFSFDGTSPRGEAFLTNPTDCASESALSPGTTVRVDTWQQPGAFSDSTVGLPAVTGCDRLAALFQPTFGFQPVLHEAASPSPFNANLQLPTGGLTEADELAAPELKTADVTLPRGVDVNPASANGLQACSEAQIGLTTTSGGAPNPIRFNKAEPACPDASKLGTVEVETPLLEEKLEGTIYLAAQEENPFHSLLALYLVVDDAKTGIVLKLPGEVRPDPSTGQLTATFDNNPQLPFSQLRLRFRGGGPRSPLATPAVCGTYTTHGELTPWSAPESGPPAQTEDTFQVTGGPGGGSCASSEASLPFSPSFEAGTTSTAAGAYAPLVIKVARKDGEQELTHLDFTLPPGLTGKLAGIPYCPDVAIEAAKGETGKAEQSSPSCPAASELGTVDTSAGVGSEPIHVGGHVYLAGPYEGAPLSAVVITPAVAGPFDLGDVVVRAGLYVNPETAQITAKSDEIPHVLRGIPLQVRSVEIKVIRNGFTLNPTSCNPMTASSSLSGLNGGGASPSSRFQVGGCSALPFKPQLKLSVLGKTNRNAKPRLKAVLTSKGGEANIRRAQVNLPHSEFLEQDHIKTVCTRVQFAEGNGNGSACPKGSIYGKAKAWTPLLDHPLEGYVYLRSNGGERKLPDLVAGLDGQINIALWGKVDSGPNHGIRNTFEVVPDAPVSRFVLEMNGGKKGLLVNSEPLCKQGTKRQAIVRLTGQNGKVRAFKPLVANSCKKQGKGKTKKH